MTESPRLAAGEIGLAYGAALLALLVLDGLWLGLLAKDLYRREMGALMTDSVRIAPAVGFYVLYPAALVYLTMLSAPAGWGEAALRGAVLGLAAYGAYDLTNLAIVKGWPVSLTFIDLGWGAAITAASACAAYAATWARH